MRKKGREEWDEVFIDFRGRPKSEISLPAVYSSPSDRSFTDNVPASPRRAGFDQRVCAGRNPSAHLSF